MTRLFGTPGAWQRAAMTVAVLLALGLRLAGGTSPSGPVLGALFVAVILTFAVAPAWRNRLLRALALLMVWNALLVAALGLAMPQAGAVGAAFWLAVIAVWMGGWMLVAYIGELPRGRGVWGQAMALVAPVVFGLTILWAWETVVHALGVPRVILPAPSEIGVRLVSEGPTLWTDLVQTFVRGTLSGFVIGCGAAILFALVVDRYDFLRRGLLPVGNFLAALPIIGTAPIFVMWFGFDWPSKAAVVVAMVFFPMLVNTVQGLASTDSMQRDLMRTYSAGWWQTLTTLRLPAAMPFVFNGLKICATLALIGAIVAEFFGSPTRGMGFRISTEVGRLQLDMVWAEIAVAALLGSAFYGFWALLERRVTFWHPSQRGR
jgi:NitT/TauT family transport system permease protein